MINSPSLANCDLLTIGEQVKELSFGGITMFHVDIMDGHYVPNLCFPVNFVETLKKAYPDIAVDVHLMVDDPMSYIEPLHKCGADYVSFHADSTNFVRRTVMLIKEKEMKAGVVINPSQKIDVIEPYINLLDLAVLMTVEPGYAGQRFLSGSLERISELDALRKKHNADFKILIDGGVDYENAKDCVSRGADILVTGIYITFNQPCGIIEAVKKFDCYINQ